MHCVNDLDARPDYSIETEPPREQPLPIIAEEQPVKEDDTHHLHISIIDDADNKNPDQPEGQEFVDTDPDLTELDGN